MSGNKHSALWSLSTDIAYLNHGSYGAVPRQVEQTQSDFQRRAQSNPNRWFRFELPDLLIRARETTANWLGVPTAQFAFVPNASQGVICAVQALVDEAKMRHQRCHLVATSLGYGGVLYGIQLVAQRSNATIGIANLTYPSDVTTQTIVTRIREVLPQPKIPTIVVLDQITSETGLLLSVADIIAQLKATHPHVQFVIDGAHGAGMLETPVPTSCDVWVGNFHKWLCAPRPSAGLVCASPQIASVMAPLAASWGYENGFPLSFDWQGTSDYSAYLATPAAISFQQRWSYDDRNQHNTLVVDGGAALLRNAWGVDGHLRISSDEPREAPWMRMVRLPKTGAVARALTSDQRNKLMYRAGLELHAECTIMTVGAENYVRLSAHMYNEVDDYEALAGLPTLV